MQIKQHINKAPLSSIITMTAAQLSFYLTAIIWLYFIVTLNWIAIILGIIIIIIQIPFNGRNQQFVDFMIKYSKPNLFYNFIRVYEEDIPDQERTLFCYCPHSVFCLGLLLNMNHPMQPNSKLSKAVTLASQFALSTPIYGQILKWWGLESASAHHFKKLLKQGIPISLVTGGYQQATLTTPKQMRIYIKQRLGFIKYALQNNYTIRIALVMNEHKAMNTTDLLMNLRLLLNKIKIPGTIYWGRYGIFYPPNVQATTVISKGLKGRHFEEGEKATQQEVQDFHAKYIEELKQFYERHKQKNGNVPMKIY